jgi:hypothetical protein
MKTNPEEDEPPECGTAVALTYFLVTYIHQGDMRINEGTYCCSRHIPRPKDTFPEGAQVMEVLIADSQIMTIVQGGTAMVKANTSGSLVNVSDPQAWTAYDGEPTLFPVLSLI